MLLLPYRPFWPGLQPIPKQTGIRQVRAKAGGFEADFCCGCGNAGHVVTVGSVPYLSPLRGFTSQNPPKHYRDVTLSEMFYQGAGVGQAPCVRRWKWSHMKSRFNLTYNGDDAREAVNFASALAVGFDSSVSGSPIGDGETSGHTDFYGNNSANRLFTDTLTVGGLEYPQDLPGFAWEDLIVPPGQSIYDLASAAGDPIGSPWEVWAYCLGPGDNMGWVNADWGCNPAGICTYTQNTHADLDNGRPFGMDFSFSGDANIILLTGRQIPSAGFALIGKSRVRNMPGAPVSANLPYVCMLELGESTLQSNYGPGPIVCAFDPLVPTPGEFERGCGAVVLGSDIIIESPAPWGVRFIYNSVWSPANCGGFGWPFNAYACCTA